MYTFLEDIYVYTISDSPSLHLSSVGYNSVYTFANPPTSHHPSRQPWLLLQQWQQPDDTAARTGGPPSTGRATLTATDTLPTIFFSIIIVSVWSESHPWSAFFYHILFLLGL
jgi:hypothetical protein